MIEMESWLTIIGTIIGSAVTLITLYKHLKQPLINLWYEVHFLLSKIKKRYFPKAIIVKGGKTIMLGACETRGNDCISMKGQKPVTQVQTLEGNHINVCIPCLEDNLKTKKWKRK